MPARPVPKEDTEIPARGSAPTAGGIPFGGLLMIAGVAVVFIYGIVLKASGPAPAPSGTPSIAAAGKSEVPIPSAAGRPGSEPPASRSGAGSGGDNLHAQPQDSVSNLFGDTEAEPGLGDQNKPLIPESTSAALSPSGPINHPPTGGSGSIPGGSTSPIQSASGSGMPANARISTAIPSVVPPAGRPSQPSSASSTSSTSSTVTRGSTSRQPVPAAPSVSAQNASSASAPRTETASGSAAAPPAGTGDAVTTAAVADKTDAGAAPPTTVPTTTGSLSGHGPRGEAPAAAVRRAKQKFAARDYSAAAHAWNDWAGSVPSGSWTVQIAAVRLDRAGAASSLAALSSRDGMFVLPAGALAGRLSPVCVGIYPSEEAARRALATTAPYPGSTSRPIVKPLHAVRAGG